MIMHQDLRADNRSLLQFIIEEVIRDGYETLRFEVYSMLKLQENPDALPEDGFSYLGDPKDFERTLRDERDQCFLFNLSMHKDVCEVFYDTEKKYCSIEVLL